MANKPIGQLTEATSVTSSDLFVLEQTGIAKKLTGQTLENWLVALADGHGGIQSIVKTGTSGLVDTYTITYADTTTSTFTVTNGADGANGTDGTDGIDGTTFTPSVSAAGVISWTNDGGKQNPPSVSIKGNQGDASYAYVRWASEEPTSDADIGVIPDDWWGIYVGTEDDPSNLHYTDYQWFLVKGATGNDGFSPLVTVTPITGGNRVSITDAEDTETFDVMDGTDGTDGDPITSVERTGGDGSPGTDDTYTCYVNSTAVGTFIVHNGSDGLGTVNSVNSIGVDAGTNNITLTASDVGAPTIPLHLAVASFSSLPKTISNASITSTMRVIECVWGTPSAITSNVTWTTSSGTVVLSGSMSGSTTVDLVLIETT